MITETPQDWRKKILQCIQGCTQDLKCTRSQSKSRDFIAAWARLSCWSWKIYWGGRVPIALFRVIKTGDRDIGGVFVYLNVCWKQTSYVGH